MVCFFLSTYSKFHFLLHVWHRLLTTIKLFCVRYAKSQTERERRKFLVRLSLTSLLFLKSIIANYIFVDLFFEAHNKISKVKILCLKCYGKINTKKMDLMIFILFILLLPKQLQPNGRIRAISMSKECSFQRVLTANGLWSV